MEKFTYHIRQEDGTGRDVEIEAKDLDEADELIAKETDENSVVTLSGFTKEGDVFKRS